MTFSIRKSPVKFSISGALTLTACYGVSAYFFESQLLQFVLLVTFGSALALLFLRSFVLPFLDGGVEVDGDKIEAVTGLGGLNTIQIHQLDPEKSFLSPLGLNLVPMAGESLFLSTTEYSYEEILRLAHYIGLSDSGWSQGV